jgi:hypothetical protein
VAVLAARGVRERVDRRSIENRRPALDLPARRDMVRAMFRR